MSFAGTVAWMAPEVIRNEPVSEKVDIWWVLFMEPSPSLQSLGFPALSMSFPHPVPEHGLLCIGLFISASAWCPELWWALMEREWHRFQLRLSAVCVLQEANAEIVFCVLIQPRALSSAVLRPPQLPPQPQWFFHHFWLSSGPLWSCGEAPALLPCASCTPGWLFYGQPQDYSPMNPIPDTRGRKPG